MEYEQWLESRRYRVLRSTNREAAKPITEPVPGETGLKFEEARSHAETLQEAANLQYPNRTSWTKDLYFIELETSAWRP